MSRVPENFSNHVKATSTLFNSDNVARILNTYDTLMLTPGDFRREEPELRQALKIEKDEIMREQQVTKNLTSEINILESKCLNLLEEKRTIEVDIEEKCSEKIPCKEDEEKLNKLGEKLRLYKDITSIRWDYSAPENLIKGYICGHLKNYVHTFKIPLNDPEAKDRLWQEIENASLKTPHNSKGKENVAEEIIISAPKKQ